MRSNLSPEELHSLIGDDTEGWEKSFDDKFELESEGCSECGGFELIDKTMERYPRGKYYCEYDLEKIKDFIRDLLSSHLTLLEGKEIVICSGIKLKDGRVLRCHRHGDGMLNAHHNGWELAEGTEQQGFVTSKGRYVSRQEGRKLQDEAGIKSADREGYRGDTLFSEDLY